MLALLTPNTVWEKGPIAGAGSTDGSRPPLEKSVVFSESV